ncbi:MAG: thioredoxin domain-containing protein [Armatimonadota bacterium]|nr:thioredoxin domain-containing protein [Armatimonadota bacterium]MDR7486295.1 thioredoxin domain-containing protein [Armatimonadota bacterium]MDR7532270.1 thioredoxin domain-containing protein [Armatimonadota bacterium]MDR7537257.1 thioredoxin domain-containing protein [Armatimonadota bacterium]
MTHGRRPAGGGSLWLAAAAGVAVAVLVAVIHYRTPAPPTLTVSAPPEPGGKTRGAAAAPVAVEIFSDFLCRHCATLAREVEPALVARYVEPGAARLVYRNFPVLGPLSEQAAVASECAVEQRHFWAYHDRLFARARRGALRSARDLEAAAREVGLAVEAFNACRAGDAARARVEADVREGLRRGVRGTPTSFVDGRMIVGAQPLEVFGAAIEAARAR